MNIIYGDQFKIMRWVLFADTNIYVNEGGGG